MFFDTEETFSDIETDSMGLTDSLINDTPFYFHDKNYNNNNYYNYRNQDIKHIYDCDDFPMTVYDVESLEEPSLVRKAENIQIEETVEEEEKNRRILEAGEVLQTLMVPVVVGAGEENHLSYKSDSEESRTSDSSEPSSASLTEDSDSPTEDPKCWPSRVRRAARRRYTTEESDEDWEPEEEEPVRKRHGQSGARRKPCRYGGRRKEEIQVHKPPVPQRRKSGTKKITQWILSLLRDPEYNPRVISWEDEKKGIFYITDTAKYARLWGERKKNPSMNYEKLSRAMRYYYKNGELSAVEKRTTYQVVNGKHSICRTQIMNISFSSEGCLISGEHPRSEVQSKCVTNED